LLKRVGLAEAFPVGENPVLQDLASDMTVDTMYFAPALVEFRAVIVAAQSCSSVVMAGGHVVVGFHKKGLVRS
jgi:hypothetical protein